MCLSQILKQCFAVFSSHLVTEDLSDSMSVPQLPWLMSSTATSESCSLFQFNSAGLLKEIHLLNAQTCGDQKDFRGKILFSPKFLIAVTLKRSVLYHAASPEIPLLCYILSSSTNVKQPFHYTLLLAWNWTLFTCNLTQCNSSFYVQLLQKLFKHLPESPLFIQNVFSLAVSKNDNDDLLSSLVNCSF